MALIPYLSEASKAPTDTVINWLFVNAKGDKLVNSHITAIDGGAAMTVYPVSFIACDHPDGKSWESLFLPLDATGLTGISVTWWNRKKGLPGQINLKPCSQAEFYDTVASKAVHKGYEVISFIGREIGLTRRHSFVEDLHKRTDSVGPCIGLTVSHLCSGSELGTDMIESACALPPIANFFNKLTENMHVANFIYALEEVKRGVRPAQKKIIEGIEDGLNEIGFGSDVFAINGVTDRVPTPPTSPTPPKKEEIYSGWGVFG